MLHSFFAYTVYIGAHSKYFIPLGAHDQQSGQRCGKHHLPRVSDPRYEHGRRDGSLLE